MKTNSDTNVRILTFDIEEWFHILDHNNTRSPEQWDSFESRIHANVDRILELLAKYNCKATFFCLGWVAKKYPEIIKKISSLGYEIGTHSNNHQLVYELTPEVFKQDLKESIDLLSQITGTPITTFRAPGFSIGKEQASWAFEIMSSCGIQVDSSVFPAARAHGGFQDFGHGEPTLVKIKGHEILELPINTGFIGNKPFVFSGGGYFRLLPLHLLRALFNRSNYVMTYFHPRDFDYEQPMIPGLGFGRKLKSYVGLKECLKKLSTLLSEFKFYSISEIVPTLSKQSLPVISLD